MCDCYYEVFTGDAGESFRLNGVFRERSLDITILQKFRAFKATVQNEQLKDLADVQCITLDDYIKKLKQYFTCSGNNVVYKCCKNKFFVNITLQSGITVIYFQCTLEEVDFNTCVLDFIDSLAFERANLTAKLKLSEKKTVDCEKANNKLVEKLNELIERKNNEEDTLFSNFSLILNEKKKRIQYLNDLLIALKHVNPSEKTINELKRRGDSSCANLEEEEEINSSDESLKSADYGTNDDSEIKSFKNEGSENEIDTCNTTCSRSLQKRIKTEIDAPNRLLHAPSTSKQCKGSDEIILVRKKETSVRFDTTVTDNS